MLEYAWNIEQYQLRIRGAIMDSMSDLYRSDVDNQLHLVRILDIANDLHALSSLLNHQWHQFVIELVILGSQRQDTNFDLGQWLKDKICSDGDLFVESIVGFLKKQCPEVIGAATSSNQTQKTPRISLEVALKLLFASFGAKSMDLHETVHQMLSNCDALLKRANKNPVDILDGKSEFPRKCNLCVCNYC